MMVTYERREQLAPSIWQYYFRPERTVDYIPGQYVSLHLPVLGDPRGPARTFTLTSLPSDELISFVVKIPEPHSPYKQILLDIEPGTIGKIDDAMGDLVLPKLPTVPLVFVAGGIGVASYVSMVRSLTTPRVINMFYALRTPDEQLFTSIFEPLRPMLFVAPDRLQASQVVENQLEDTQYYLSGSERFVEGLRADLTALSVPHEQIVFDYYDGYVEL
jgi:ferredoxin-NADP reductase